jgi:hypothetical protein
MCCPSNAQHGFAHEGRTRATAAPIPSRAHCLACGRRARLFWHGDRQRTIERLPNGARGVRWQHDHGGVVRRPHVGVSRFRRDSTRRACVRILATASVGLAADARCLWRRCSREPVAGQRRDPTGLGIRGRECMRCRVCKHPRCAAGLLSRLRGHSSSGRARWRTVRIAARTPGQSAMFCSSGVLEPRGREGSRLASAASSFVSPVRAALRPFAESRVPHPDLTPCSQNAEDSGGSNEDPAAGAAIRMKTDHNVKTVRAKS